LRGVGRECVGEQRTNGRVELLSSPSPRAIVRAVLRGIKRRIVLRLPFLLCRRRLFWPSEAWPSEALGLPRRGLARRCLERHGAFRGMVLRDLEEINLVVCLGWSGMVVRRSGSPVDASQSHPFVSNSVLQVFFPSSSCDCACLTMMAVRYCRWLSRRARRWRVEGEPAGESESPGLLGTARCCVC
jgi:hypothetical protein